MRALVQEACQGPVRDAVAAHGAQLTALSASDLRPLNLRDFQVIKTYQFTLNLSLTFNHK